MNYGLWVTVMCQCRFMEKHTTLVGDVDNGGSYTCVGQWYMGNL